MKIEVLVIYKDMNGRDGIVKTSHQVYAYTVLYKHGYQVDLWNLEQVLTQTERF